MSAKEQKKININKNPFDFVLCITVLILLVLGIVMVLSASAPTAMAEGDTYKYVKKQALFAVAGIALMLFLSKVDYRNYKKLYKIAYWGSIVALISVLIPGLGIEENGATRWIDLKFFTLQPSEIAKIGLIVFFAGYLSEHKNELGSFLNGFVKPLAALILPIAILFVIQKHLSASIIIICVTCIMMLMAGTKLKYFITVGIPIGSIAAAGVALLAIVKGVDDFRIKRIFTFIDPFADPTDKGWQIIQSLYAIGSGGLFGVGLGQSKQKYLYIPEPHNDFIFAILAEELGFVGCLVVIILFIIFIWRGILSAIKAPDTFGSLLAIGITSLIGIQAIMNIAVVTSSMPVTGISLPFFSYGGTSLLILLGSVGVLLNISKLSSKV